ncbi:putative secondary metabolism biosynthetic enzyme [Diaporthe australafricana]|uniref:Secondary metabolism biosynthetic enzyme n=1 Tax=Diaporthe australafricana TaxID=127596 RepID=A0ABR3WBS9_9PEZI
MRDHNPRLKLLDVGTGPGTITIGFAQAIPQGHVTAVDLNPEALSLARAAAKTAGVDNMEFLEADIHQLPFADGTFDITHCHQVLTHIKAPWDAIRELVRVTKPGGIVAAREGDLASECIWPEISGLTKFHNFVSKIMELAGGSVSAGRQLLDWALRAGVDREQINLTYGTWGCSSASDKKTWARAMIHELQTNRWREAGLKAGIATEQDLDEMAIAWNEWAESDRSTLAMIQGQVIIQKN